MYYKIALTSSLLLLLALGVLSQDCPPHGCNCPFFNSFFDAQQGPTTLCDSLQHNTGNHCHTMTSTGTGTFTDGPYVAGQGYECNDFGNLSTTNTWTETGGTRPTYIGNQTPAVHYVGPNESSCTLNGLGKITLTVAAVFSATECKSGDPLCGSETITMYGGNCSTSPLYTSHLGSYGSVLWRSPYVTLFTLPTLYAPAPSPIVIPLAGGDFTDDPFTDIEHGVTFNATEKGNPMRIAWIEKGASSPW